MKRLIWSLVTVAVLLFVWYLFADRMTPFTSNARVQAIVVPIVARVSGLVTGVAVSNNQFIEAGDVLAQIDQQPYLIAIDKAEAALETAKRDLGVQSADVENAQARLRQAESSYQNVQVQSERVFELERKGFMAIAKADAVRTQLKVASDEIQAARSDLDRTLARFGEDQTANPVLQSAVAQLNKALLDFEWTTLTAPSFGAVIDLQTDEGSYAKAGNAVMTFVSAEDIWVEAYLKENNLGRITEGNPVEISLDLYPGRIIDGVVASVGRAAQAGTETTAGQLPLVQNSTKWLRDPQRFPVVIYIPGYERGNLADDIEFVVNGQADIIVYTGENWLMNRLGELYIRLVSVFSYAY